MYESALDNWREKMTIYKKSFLSIESNQFREDFYFINGIGEKLQLQLLSEIFVIFPFNFSSRRSIEYFIICLYA